MDKLIAIIRGVEPEHINDVTQALLEGGVNWLEVSLSDEEKGLKCIQKIQQTFGDHVNLGAGTVINEDQVDASLAAGATFIITPEDRKSTRLNSSHVSISYAVFCLKK